MRAARVHRWARGVGRFALAKNVPSLRRMAYVLAAARYTLRESHAGLLIGREHGGMQHACAMAGAQRTLLLQKRSAAHLGGVSQWPCSPPRAHLSKSRHYWDHRQEATTRRGTSCYEPCSGRRALCVCVCVRVCLCVCVCDVSSGCCAKSCIR